MKVRRLDHLVFAVQELGPAAESWAQTFGLVAEPPRQPEGTHLELALLPLENAALELVADMGWGEPALSGAERVARFLAEQGEGMFSISLEVDDLDAAVPALRAKGLPVSGPEPGILPGTRVARVPRVSAHGVAVQLIERTSQ